MYIHIPSPYGPLARAYMARKSPLAVKIPTVSAQKSQVLAIIGQGYVGLPLAMAAVDAGWTVIGIDNLEAKVAQINSGSSPIEDISDAHLKAAIAKGAYKATTDFSTVTGVSVITICVPTPLNGKREPDIALLRSAATGIAPFVSNETLVVSESTSYPGTLRDVIIPLVNSLKSADASKIFYASAPERVNPGDPVWDQKNTPRLYSGLTLEASKKTCDFYSTFCDNLVEVSSPEVAEAAKLFENTFRQVNIALVNEFAQITHALGISVYETLNAADTKPYGFLKFKPSLGVGGHCIPIDPIYLADTASKLGIETKFINLANETNLEMPNYIVSRIESDLGKTLKNKTILILGVAYKPNVADTRETPSKLLINELRKRGADVYWHDPLVELWNGEVSSNLQEVDAIVIAQMHDQFLKVKLETYSEYIFDCTGTYATPNSL